MRYGVPVQGGASLSECWVGPVDPQPPSMATPQPLPRLFAPLGEDRLCALQWGAAWGQQSVGWWQRDCMPAVRPQPCSRGGDVPSRPTVRQGTTLLRGA